MISDFKIIDAHMHLNSGRNTLPVQARECGVHLVTINTEVPEFPPLYRQEEIAHTFDDKNVSFIAGFSTEGWGRPGWKKDTINRLSKSMEKGAIGIKVWKNIGMSLQDEAGNFVMIDHPSFDFLFEFCERENIPVLGHLGEPKNCWLPIDKMTVQSDREYFSSHPEYHMYRHPEHPSYDEQLEARDQRLDNHPDLVFIGAHLSSLEWSVEKQAEWLDRYPNAAMDMAERINHLQYQAVSEYEKVRSFLIEYSDRLLYGTDIIEDGIKSPEAIVNRSEALWRHHWMFFAEGNEMQSGEFAGSIRGMELPDDVLRKIFRKNALKWYTRLFDEGFG